MPVGNTTRERVESMTGVGTCGAACHVNWMNPIGYGLENYDAIGQYRSQENAYEVNSSAVLALDEDTELEFENAIELSDGLAEMREVHQCYAERLLEYVLGHPPAAGERLLSERLAMSSHEANSSLKSLVLELVKSPVFRSRSASEL